MRTFRDLALIVRALIVFAAVWAGVGEPATASEGGLNGSTLQFIGAEIDDPSPPAVATRVSHIQKEFGVAAGALGTVLMLGTLYMLFGQALSEGTRVPPSKLPAAAGPIAAASKNNEIGLIAARGCGLLAIAIGILVLLGWTFHIETLQNVLHGLVAMQPWTAAGIVLAGGALLASTAEHRSPIAITLALTVVAIGGQALLQHATGTTFGSDVWLFPETVRHQPAPYQHPGRPSPATSLALVTFGIVVLLSRRRARWTQAAFSTLGTAGLLWSAAGLLGYLLDLEGLVPVPIFSMLAIHTAFALTLLFVGALASHPTWVAMLSGSSPGAISARTMLPIAVIGPVLLAMIFEKGRLSGFYGEEFRLALVTLSTIGLLATSVLWNGIRLNRAHAAQQAAVDEIRRSELRYRTLADATKAVTWSCPSLGLHDVPQPAWTEFTGQRAGSRPGIGWADAVHADLRAGFVERWREAVESTEPFGADARVLRHDGTWRWLNIQLVPIRGSDGRIVEWTGCHIDITDRKEAEEALFREKERAEVTLNSIGDAVIVTDAWANITFLNPVAETLTGYPLADARQMPLGTVFQIVNEETREPAESPVERCLREGRVVGLANHTILIGRDGSEYSIDDSAAPIRDHAGAIVGVVLVFHDISETRRLARQLEHDAAHDELTGLVNRREFERRLERTVAASRRQGARHALCYFDLDQFKLLNDTAGHVAGDALLKQVRGMLAGKFRERDTLARLGGDEFALLLDNCGLLEAARIAETIVTTFREWRFTWRGQGFQASASVGVVAIGPDSESADQVLAQADVACYTAKEQGRNRVSIYQGGTIGPSPHHARMLLAASLVDAQRNDRFRLFGQPIVPLADGERVSGRLEILLRLIGENGEYIMPDIVIPAAERYGLMADLDRWIIERALRSVGSGGGDRPPLSINLSGASLNTDDLGDFVLGAFARYDVAPERICFEITETAAVHNLEQAVKFIQEVRRQGCTIALDDFGSGMSSFRYLRKLPIDYLKIDGSFVRNICSSEHDEAVVTAINEVGHKLGIRTIAEYVHDQATANRARSLQIDFAQGYAFGAPAPFSTTIH